MSRNLLSLAIATLMLGATGCTSYSISTDYSPQADFSNYRTFGFMPGRTLLVATTQPVSPLILENLKYATRQALEAKMLRHTDDPEQADFVISFTLGSRDKISVTSYPTAYRGSWGWGGVYHQNVDVRDYTEGMLAIDVFDVKGRQPVWHGVAKKNIQASDRGNRELLNEIVAAILAEFPPG